MCSDSLSTVVRAIGWGAVSLALSGRVKLGIRCLAGAYEHSRLPSICGSPKVCTVLYCAVPIALKRSRNPGHGESISPGEQGFQDSAILELSSSMVRKVRYKMKSGKAHRVASGGAITCLASQ
jgi:hypothetical protein